MRAVALSFDDDARLAASTEFLRRARPLAHVAPVKKSQVQHALCDMLAAILRPLARAPLPPPPPPLPAAGAGAGAAPAALDPALLAEWHALAMRLKNEVGQWVNKHTKHVADGYPLVAALVCLADAAQAARQADALAEFLVKQMRARDYRALCFRCLGRVLVAYLARATQAPAAAAAAGALAPPQAAWLDRVARPALAIARKGGAGAHVSAQEQLEFLVGMADLSPDYVAGALLPEMLQQADAPDAQLVALRALQVVLTSVPAARAAAALDGVAPFSDGGGGGGGDGGSNGSSSGAEQAAADVLAAAVAASGGEALSLDAAARLRRSASAGRVAAAFSGGPSAGARRMVQAPMPVALALVRAGRHPLALQGAAHLLPRLQGALAALLSACHRACGGAVGWVAEAPAAAKDRGAHAVLLVWVLRLLPLLEPGGWAPPPLDLLAR